MKSKANWNYKIISSYLNYMFLMRNFPNKLFLNSVEAKEISDFLNVSNNTDTFTPDNLISNIFSNRHSSNFVMTSFEGNIHKFHTSPKKYIAFPIAFKEGLLQMLLHVRKKEKLASLSLIYDKSLNLHTNVSNISEKNNLLPIEIYAFLYEKGELIFEKNTIIKIKDQEMNKKEIEKEIEKEDRISILREDIAKAFNHCDENYNLFLMTDGTGTGKTHNSVMNFVKAYPNAYEKNVLVLPKRRNLIFIAPQKNQFFVNSDVWDCAKLNNVPLLFPRPSVDFVNLDSKCFLSYSTGKRSFKSVKDFFDDLFKIEESGAGDKKTIKVKFKDGDIVNQELQRLYRETAVKRQKKKSKEDSENENIAKIPSFDLFLSSYLNYRNFENNHGMEKKYNLDGYKEDYERAQISFSMNLKAMGNFLASNLDDIVLEKVFQNGSVYQGFDKFKDLFKKSAVFYEVVYLIIAYTLPFEVAKYVNSVIYMSGDKSKTLLYISEQSLKNKELKVVRGYDLEDMVSGYSISQEADVLKAYKDPSIFSEFLSSEYFIKNELNYFLKNDIGFSVVEDEEHVLYNKFLDQYTFKNITEDGYGGKKLNIVHALAAIDRWIKNSKNNQRNVMNFNDIVEEKHKIITQLKSNLKLHTVLKTDDDIEKFFNMVSPNDFGVFAKMSDMDFITSVCENIISFSPKLMVLKEYLEQIKMVLREGEDSLLVAKDISDCVEGSVFYSVYDFFQILLTVMFVFKDSSKNLKDLIFSESHVSHQNLALYYLLNLASNNKGFLNNLFSSSIDLKGEDPVNIQFSYFLTKIGFNFVFPEFIEKQEYDKSCIRVEPKIFIIKELPEVGVLQMLRNKKNKVFLLSATRGLNNIFSGNYSEYFFNEMDKYVPGELNIFKRENFVDNPMPAFINERFNARKSIEVIKMNVDNQSSKVNLLTYPVPSVELSYVVNPNGEKPINKSYDLVKKSSNKNFLDSVISSAKKTNIFSSLWNPYHKAELVGTLNSIIHAFENNENAIVMTLSNRFENFLDDEDFVSMVFKNCQHLCVDENRNKIIEWKPIVNSPKKLRLVFFDAELGRMTNLSDYFRVDDDTIVVLVSSYGSAGTGLNLTLEDQSKKEFDFSSLYIVSSPYYSNIMSDNGYSSMSNQLLIYKYFAHMGNKTINDLSEGLASKEIKSILYREHIIEKVKSIMQSSGRIERRDFYMDTKIYFVENGLSSIFDETMSHFNQMYKLHSNNCERTVVPNFSMLNKALLYVALKSIAQKSLTVEQRNLLEKDSRESYDVFVKFFNYKNGFLLSKYRSLDPDYDWVAEFNGILRAYKSPDYDFKGALKSFIDKNKDVLKKTEYYTDMINLYKHSMIDLSKHNIDVSKIAIDYTNFKYTDFSNSVNGVTDRTFFDYGEDIRESEIASGELFLRDVFSNCFKYKTLTALPNIYMIHVIKGNIGEEILENYFQRMDIVYNNIDKVLGKKFEKMLYEVFDFYVIKDNKIYAIDTKNWSLYNDSGAKKMLEKIDSKLLKLKKIAEITGYSFECIYLNMFPKLNAAYSNGLSSHLSKFDNVRYMNFIVNEQEYKQKTVKNKKVYKKEKVVLRINEEWKKIILAYNRKV